MHRGAYPVPVPILVQLEVLYCFALVGSVEERSEHTCVETATGMPGGALK